MLRLATDLIESFSFAHMDSRGCYANGAFRRHELQTAPQFVPDLRPSSQEGQKRGFLSFHVIDVQEMEARMKPLRHRTAVRQSLEGGRRKVGRHENGAYGHARARHI